MDYDELLTRLRAYADVAEKEFYYGGDKEVREAIAAIEELRAELEAVRQGDGDDA